MLQNKKLSDVTGAMWRIILSGVVFAIGLIISRLLFYALDVVLPRMPQQANESVAAWYLFGGSLLLSAGLFALIRGITGAWMERLLSLCLFFFTGFGISTTVESAIYSDVEGYMWMIPVLLLPVLLFSVISVWLIKPPSTTKTLAEKAKIFFRFRSAQQWVKRLLLAAISFPVIYFVFGIVVSPFVTGYYSESGYGLVIPPVGLIIGVQFFRSLLFLLVTLPVMISWEGSKNHLIAGLGLAHFVMVFVYDIVLAYQLPIELVLIHGVEILFDSMVYSWVIVRLLYTNQSRP